MNEILITVFTPIYNRSHTIRRVWNSLNQQTFKNFEWLVINDGSTDNILDLLDEYKARASFPIRVFSQANSGKHFAWNRAIQLAKGELFVPADSDDEFIPTSLEFFINHWKQIDNVNQFSGINVLCKHPETGEIIGDLFPKDNLVSNNLELAYKYQIKGEKWGCIQTRVLREFPFPKFGKGTYYKESYIWFSLARKYDVLCLNTALRLYYPPDMESISATSKTKIIKMAPTEYHYQTWHLNTNFDYIKRYLSILKLSKLLVKYCYIGIIAGISFPNIIEGQNKIRLKILIFLYWPLGKLYSILTKRKQK